MPLEHQETQQPINAVPKSNRIVNFFVDKENFIVYFQQRVDKEDGGEIMRVSESVPVEDFFDVLAQIESNAITDVITKLDPDNAAANLSLFSAGNPSATPVHDAIKKALYDYYVAKHGLKNMSIT